MDKQQYYLLRKLLDPVVFLEHFVRLQNPSGIEPWKLDSYQKHIVHDYSRNRVVNKSKKTGISTTISGEAIHRAFIYPNRQLVFVSTSERIAGELLGKLYDELSTLPQPLQPTLGRKSAMETTFPNGSRILSLPNNPATIRGLGMRGSATEVYIDEYAHIPNDNELWVVVRDFQRFGGRISVISTPKGKRGKYCEIAEPLQVVHRKLAPPFPTDWSYHEIPFTRCPRLKDQEKALRTSLTEMDFQQEYCCSFIDESLSFFPYQMIWNAQKVYSYAPSDFKSKNPVYMGVDFGQRVSETVIIVVEETEPEQFKILSIICLPGVDYTSQMEEIKQLNRIFNPTLINIDASGPGGNTMYDFLSKEADLASKVWGYELTTKFKERIIIRTRILTEHGRLLLPTKDLKDGEKLENQLHSVQRMTTPSGEHTRYSGKVLGGMDDMVWALALSVWRETTTTFEPFFEQVKDDALRKLTR